jgi:hypothetical protein
MGIAWGRKLMWQGEDLQVFGEEQSGGRKGKRCQDVLLFKHLVYQNQTGPRLTTTRNHVTTG